MSAFFRKIFSSWSWMFGPPDPPASTPSPEQLSPEEPEHQGPERIVRGELQQPQRPSRLMRRESSSGSSASRSDSSTEEISSGGDVSSQEAIGSSFSQEATGSTSFAQGEPPKSSSEDSTESSSTESSSALEKSSGRDRYASLREHLLSSVPKINLQRELHRLSQLQSEVTANRETVLHTTREVAKSLDEMHTALSEEESRLWSEQRRQNALLLNSYARWLDANLGRMVDDVDEEPEADDLVEESGSGATQNHLISDDLHELEKIVDRMEKSDQKSDLGQDGREYRYETQNEFTSTIQSSIDALRARRENRKKGRQRSAKGPKAETMGQTMEQTREEAKEEPGEEPGEEFVT